MIAHNILFREMSEIMCYYVNAYKHLKLCMPVR